MGEHETFVPEDEQKDADKQTEEAPEGWWICPMCEALNPKNQGICTRGDYSRVSEHSVET